MRRIRRHMLRLAREGVSAREIGRTLGIGRSTVQDNLACASAAGLAWPIDEEITDVALEQRLFDRVGVKQGVRRLVEPDWPSMVREMRRPGNLMVLWEEYRGTEPGGYGYSRFCDAAAQLVDLTRLMLMISYRNRDPKKNERRRPFTDI